MTDQDDHSEKMASAFIEGRGGKGTGSEVASRAVSPGSEAVPQASSTPDRVRIVDYHFL